MRLGQPAQRNQQLRVCEASPCVGVIVFTTTIGRFLFSRLVTSSFKCVYVKIFFFFFTSEGSYRAQLARCGSSPPVPYWLAELMDCRRIAADAKT